MAGERAPSRPHTPSSVRRFWSTRAYPGRSPDRNSPISTTATSSTATASSFARRLPQTIKLICNALAVAHHKRKRPKHRRSGCLLCKPQKLTANAKAARRRLRQESLEHERAADEIVESIAAERIRSGAADHSEDGAKALERIGIVVPLTETDDEPRGASGG